MIRPSFGNGHHRDQLDHVVPARPAPGGQPRPRRGARRRPRRRRRGDPAVRRRRPALEAGGRQPSLVPRRLPRRPHADLGGRLVVRHGDPADVIPSSPASTTSPGSIGPRTSGSTAGPATMPLPRRRPPTVVSSWSPTARGRCRPGRCAPARAAPSRCTPRTSGRGASTAGGDVPAAGDVADGRRACARTGSRRRRRSRPTPDARRGGRPPRPRPLRRRPGSTTTPPPATTPAPTARAGCRRTSSGAASTRASCCAASTAASPAHDTFAKELAWRDFYADVLYHRPESAWRDVEPADGRHARRRRARGPTALRGVVRGPHRLPDRRRRHAPARRRGLDAQPGADDRGELPGQGPPRRLAARRAHFLQHLVDGDLASNNHGWQWVAGTGTDAAPYFRIFNPTSPGPEVRPRRRVRPPVGARAGRRRRLRRARAVGGTRRPARPATRRRSSTTPPSGGIPVPLRRPPPLTPRCGDSGSANLPS